MFHVCYIAVPLCVYTALYGTLFGGESEAAFSNYRLWESLGFVVAFAYSFYLCAAVKLYILTSLLVVAMLCYLAVEYLQWKSRDEALQLSVQYSTQSNTSTKSWYFCLVAYRHMFDQLRDCFVAPHKHMILCTLHKNRNCLYSFMSNSPTIIGPKWVQLQHDQHYRGL